ncbi:hypothetical protein DL96DRAFT_1823768 [Flagelloscypha sp. PMI_526]|nr:hypothetical protein DL96DRAFT_1823768 [Flagelloscypha sp. PMI_526]
MPPPLPLEIWAKILAFLPSKSLHQAKQVNHAFHQVCRNHLSRDLILVAVFTEQNVEQELQVLRNRLNVAKLHPSLIKSIRFMPSLVIPDFYTLTPPIQKKPFRLLRRLFRKPEDPIRWPIPRNASDIDEGLASLIPSLTSLEELHMEDSWDSECYSTADLALKITASRLTVLTLQFVSTTGLYNLFPSKFTIALPVLRTFRLSLIAGLDGDFEGRIQEILSASPLLQEIQYILWSGGVQTNSTSYGMDIVTHPHLKVFKWATVYTWNTPPFLPPPFASHAFHFDVIHLDPPPSLYVFSSLNMAQLVELRVDLHARTNVADFFVAIMGAEQLVILEVIGFYPYDPTNDPASLLPGTGFGQLRQLHLGILLPIFSVRSLRSLASKTVHLHKLALIVETPSGPIWTKSSLRDICEPLLYQFHLSTVNKLFSEWSLADFGILFRNWTEQFAVRITDFEGVLAAISRQVPSITSFYGTRSLRLWEGIEGEIDRKWGGELWNCWEKKW